MSSNDLSPVFFISFGIVFPVLAQLEIFCRFSIILFAVRHQAKAFIRNFAVIVELQDVFPQLFRLCVFAVDIVLCGFQNHFSVLCLHVFHNALSPDIQNQIPVIQLRKGNRRTKAVIGTAQAAEFIQHVSPAIIFEHMPSVGIENRIGTGIVHRDIPQL
ncbi:hypothetical protein SDC9_157792 [bioreactor metagenome]|uniref:Uncharacterized protein n=1 Tax=bioreactor metagenome TaxID=1076179 RepID=A0A645F8D4_9ZZZZ